MTKEEYKNQMKRYGWSDAEISIKIAEHDADSREFALSLPFELYLREKDVLRTYYVNADKILVDKEEFV